VIKVSKTAREKEIVELRKTLRVAVIAMKSGDRELYANCICEVFEDLATLYGEIYNPESYETKLDL
jgi:hypothetical protein